MIGFDKRSIRVYFRLDYLWLVWCNLNSCPHPPPPSSEGRVEVWVVDVVVIVVAATDVGEDDENDKLEPGVVTVMLSQECAESQQLWWSFVQTNGGRRPGWWFTFSSNQHYWCQLKSVFPGPLRPPLYPSHTETRLEMKVWCGGVCNTIFMCGEMSISNVHILCQLSSWLVLMCQDTTQHTETKSSSQSRESFCHPLLWILENMS